MGLTTLSLLDLFLPILKVSDSRLLRALLLSVLYSTYVFYLKLRLAKSLQGFCSITCCDAEPELVSEDFRRDRSSVHGLARCLRELG